MTCTRSAASPGDHPLLPRRPPLPACSTSGPTSARAGAHAGSPSAAPSSPTPSSAAAPIIIPFPTSKTTPPLQQPSASSGSGQQQPNALRDATSASCISRSISSFRESKSDDRRFCIITPTKTLHLRTDSASDRVAWIQALVSAARPEYSPTGAGAGGLSCDDHNDAASFSLSTESLITRNRMHAQGLDDDIIKHDSGEQLLHSQLSKYNAAHCCEEYLSFLASQQQLEVLSADGTANVIELHPHLMKSEYSCSGHGSECSNTESSDDVGKQEVDELSDDNDCHFYDTRQSFGGSAASPDLKMKISNSGKDNCLYADNFVKPKVGTGNGECLSPSFKRRTKLPEPVEKEKGVSLWSMIKDNVGKDLTRVCLPVYFNEPLSSLQKCYEDLEYSYLLDHAYECGLKGNGLMRILYVAAFAVSGYASSDGRPCKPFNPLLGETYEADYPENGIQFFSEKVSHHPMVMAFHCEGKGWKFWGDSNVQSKFWGQTIQLDPVGVLTLEFDDGETFQWSKSRKMQDNGWKPRWFERDSEGGTFRYTGGYWEAREQGKWDDCPDIFGEFRHNQKLQTCQSIC
ncbi:Oxysterol-binding protein-related protein 2A [Dichanthelium oligosanthes]|uniref:Oxysterol-binding protein-related protein 2A n=1 Tax=Dichanthelium oligosanthes TaxID=888268 RepID=A0A1E5UNW8_9POAL|nr:Oxysterol-binding protein-related protein 2A [Dichanthelium oligosanthes]